MTYQGHRRKLACCAVVGVVCVRGGAGTGGGRRRRTGQCRDLQVLVGLSEKESHWRVLSTSDMI